MEKSFLEELKREIEISSNKKWNDVNRQQVMSYLNIDNMKRQILSTEYKFMKKDESGKFDLNNIRVVTTEEKEILINLMDGKLELEHQELERKL